MAQHKRVLASSTAEVLSTGGKIASITIAVTGDRVWTIRETDGSGRTLYKLSAGVSIPHDNLHIPFKTALHVTADSGTTGEINIMVE